MDDLESLLYEGESNRLDYKREQYKFSNGTEEQKSSLLKDILSMANAFRSSDAFILIGVGEVQGGRAEVLGCEDHPDDAAIQEFVNSKTNTPVQFRYHVEIVDGKKVGVYHVPQQPRPLYATKRYGKVEANAVYYRQSTTNATASPIVVASMGRHDAEAVSLSRKPTPKLTLGLNSCGTISAIDRPITILSQHPNFDSTLLPDYGSDDRFGLGLYNTEYWRQLGNYVQARFGLMPLNFVIENTGDAAASEVILEMTVAPPLFAIMSSKFPVYRTTSVMDNLAVIPQNRFSEPDFSQSSLAYGKSYTVSIPRIQPKLPYKLNYPLYVGCCLSGTTNISFKMWATELAEPATGVIVVNHEYVPVSFEHEEDMFSLLDICADHEEKKRPGFFTFNLAELQKRIEHQRIKDEKLR